MKSLSFKKALAIEWHKQKRSGTFESLVVAGVAGSAYALANFIWRKESLLALPLDVMDILLTQLYGMIALLNLFGIIIACILVYHIEFQNRGFEKMRALSFSLGQMFWCKFLILCLGLLVAITLESLTLLGIGLYYFSKDFIFSTWLWFSLYCFLTSVPVLAFMLWMASLFESLWISLSIGVIGFLSGMALGTISSPLFLLDPFVVFLKPALEMKAQPSLTVAFIASLETSLFVLLGLIGRRNVWDF